MRRAFFETLAELGEADPRVLLLTADLGYMALEPFADRCPKQFVNVGVCEQNMVGMATGLAEAGFLPFVYSITPFAVHRAYEFIRNGPIAHRLPVRVVSVGAGFDYGTNGISHYGLDDIGVLRVQPGFCLIAPADTAQARAALLRCWSLPEPYYFRLSKEDTNVHLGHEFHLGQVRVVRQGSRVLLLALGNALAETLAAADLLQNGTSVALVDNLNREALDGLDALLRSHDLVITVEEHYLNGGLGSMVCEAVAEAGLGTRVVRCGVTCVPDGTTGSRRYMLQRNGIDATGIAARVRAALR